MPQLQKSIFLLVAASATALSLAGCSTMGSSSSPGGSTANSKIAAVIKPLDNPYFKAMEDGIKATDSSAVVQAGQSITDTIGQANLLSSLAGQGFGCYIVNPISGNNLLQGVAQLKAKNVHVVNIDSPVDATAAKAAKAVPDTYIGTDNLSAGEIAGTYMAKIVAQGAKLGVVGGIAGDVTSGNRISGFEKGLGSKATVVATASANWDRPTALTKATDMLRANPDIAGFFVANDDMALGVARAIANNGLTGKVFVISVDGILDGLKGVESGQLTATVAQYPYAMGQMGVEACQMAMAGKTIPTNVKSPVELITKDNASQAIKSAPAPFAPYDDPFKQK